MLKRFMMLLAPLGLAAAAQAIELTEEQRAAILERIAPVGEVCLQGETCGGLPKTAAASKPMAPAPAASVAAAAPEAAGAATSNAAIAMADAPAIDGEAVYNQACMACHASGAGGAPRVGDIDAWSPRIAKGIEALHGSGINGVAGTLMMAKGGRMDLSDQEVMAAVDYMVAGSQ